MMTRDIVERLVLDIVSNLVGELRGAPPALVSLDDALDRDLGIGSLERVELLVRLERQFGLRLPDRVMAEADRPADLVEVLLGGEEGAAVATVPGREGPLGAASAPPAHARTLVDTLRWHAEATPDRRHITLAEEDGRERSMTYGELWHRASLVAGGLRARDVGRGATVALMLRTEVDFFAAFYGVLIAGAVPVPVYPPFRVDRIEEFATRQAAILEDAQTRVLVTFGQAERLARLLRAEVPSIESVATVDVLAAAEAVRPARIAGDDPALIQYTSGSTGSPKGVLLTHTNLLANIRSIGQALELRPDDVVVSWLPLYHDMGLIGAWLGSLYFGLPLALMSPLAFLSRPSRWLWAFHRHRGTVSPAPNFAYELSVTRTSDDELKGLDLSSWRIALNGAEPVNPDTIDRFTRRFAPYGFHPEAMCPVYGLAESAVGLSASPVGRVPRIDRIERDPFERRRLARPSWSSSESQSEDPQVLRFPSCGQPLPGHDIRIVDDAGRTLPERTVGRIEFRGPSMMQGYYRNPEATGEIHHEGWFSSGDLGYLADGEIFVTGREKDLVILGGRNVYPQEMEDLAARVPGVRRGCVAAFGVPDRNLGTERLVIVAETRETEPVERERLRAAVIDTIAAATGLPPHTVVLVDPGAVLKTSSGKIRRSATRDAYVRGELGRGRRSVVAQWLRLVRAGLAARVVRGLSRVVDGLYTAYVGVLVGTTVAVLWLFVRLLPAGAPCDRLVRFWARALMTLSGCRLRVTGLEHLQRSAPSILVANHASYIDVVIVMAALPRDYRFVAKRALTGYPVLGTVIPKMGVLTIERTDVSTRLTGADEVIDALRRGETLFVFPEGTFGRQPGILPFRLGAFRAAVETRSPVVPIALAGTRAILPDGRRLFRRGPVQVTICAPIVPEALGWPEMVRLRDRAREEIARHCREPS